MSEISIFILGLLIGWLIEWVIDWLYWRRKYTACQQENAHLKARLEEIENTQATDAEPDNFTLIHGIGPVISDMLKDAGVTTYEALAALSPKKLREILGDLVERLSDEEDLLRQAKDLAKEKHLARRASELKKGKKKTGKEGDPGSKKEAKERATR